MKAILFWYQTRKANNRPTLHAADAGYAPPKSAVGRREGWVKPSSLSLPAARLMRQPLGGS